MTFSEEVADLGLTKESLGETLGVAFSTVQMWGEDPPLYALAYLKIFRANKDLVDEMTEWVEGLQDILPQAD